MGRKVYFIIKISNTMSNLWNFHICISRSQYGQKAYMTLLSIKRKQCISASTEYTVNELNLMKSYKAQNIPSRVTSHQIWVHFLY